MPTVHEHLSEQFHRWERRGRGWQVFDTPVSPEPPFQPFLGYCLPRQANFDDGRRPTALSSFVERLRQKFSPEPPPELELPSEEEEPIAETLIRDSLIELQTSLPANLNITRDAFEHFLSSISLCREPIAFELLGTSATIITQFAAAASDARVIQRQLQAHFPDAAFVPKEGMLETAWREAGEAETAVVEFGLAREFMHLLATRTLDPFVSLTGTLAELEAGELGLFQVLFQPARNAWAESIMCAVTDAEGEPLFVNTPELFAASREKVSRPLYAAVVRIATRAEDFSRAWDITRDMAAALGVFTQPNGNELIPLTNDEYPYEAHIDDVIRRQSHRSGMLLTSDELTGFVHLPSVAVRSLKLVRQLTKTKAARAIAQPIVGLLLGHNTHTGKTCEIRLTPEQRVRHMHVLGASGTGKSTLLFNLIRQDIEHGEGIALLDPHGDLVDRVLGIIPSHRVADVVLVDPSDEEFSIGFNILSAHSDLEKNLLASDLVSVFQRLSTSWGDQMGSVLNNAILAFLESSQGGTLSDLRRFLLEPAYRNQFLETVRDPDVVYYWRKGFSQLSGNKSIGPVLTRLETFLSPKAIRYMVSQRANKLDFASILDTGKIFLARLAQGTIGKENAYLLGTLLVAKFQQLAMSRQRVSEAHRRDFWLYIDEFHNFITPSMAEILTGARKYRIGLVLAHQELRQLQRDSDVASAVMSNSYTRVVFRVGDADARALEGGFSSFEARDLQNLGTGEAICRVERSDFDFNLKVPMPDDLDLAEAAAIHERVIAASRQTYATPRLQVETELYAKAEHIEAKESPAREPPKEQPRATARPVTPSPPVAPKPSPPLPADMGRGGAQHQAIQKRIKTAAEHGGYRAIIEAPILDGLGSVDILLEQADSVIACEIAVTTTIDHEVGNITKCLKAGFTQVAMIGVDEKKLQEIEHAVKTSLGQAEAARIAYFLPDQFIALLREHLPTQEAQLEPPAPQITIRRGYKVTRRVAKLTTEERKAQETVALKMIAEVMRKKTT
jgi:hypothetical protein